MKVSARFLQFLTVSLIRNQGLLVQTTRHSQASVSSIPTYSEIMSKQKDAEYTTCIPVDASSSTSTDGSSQARQGLTEEEQCLHEMKLRVPSGSRASSSTSSSMSISASRLLSSPAEGANCDSHDCKRLSAESEESSHSKATTLKRCDCHITEDTNLEDRLHHSTSSSPMSKKARTINSVEYTSNVPCPTSQHSSATPTLDTNVLNILKDTSQHSSATPTQDKNVLNILKETIPRAKLEMATYHGQSADIRPNAFVSICIPSSEIRQKMEEVQQKMLEEDDKLKWTFVSLGKSHLTLMVFRLDTEEEIERAKAALTTATEKVESSLMLERNPLVLKFSGIGNFSTNVVYGKVEKGPEKERSISMAEIVRKVFSEHGLPTTDTRPFSPHLTIAKVTQKSRSKGVRRIPPEAYSDVLSMDFGSQEIHGLELLSMSLPKTPEGYYHSFHHTMFSQYRI